MNIQQAAFKNIAISDSYYQAQQNNLQMLPYQPIQVFYNYMVPGVAQTNFAQQAFIPSNDNTRAFISNQQFAPSHSLLVQQQTWPQEVSQQQSSSASSSQSKFSQLNNIHQKIIFVSQLLQITNEEAVTLLSENICVCCKDKLQNKNICEVQNQEFQAKVDSSFLQKTNVQIPISTHKERDQQQTQSSTQTIQNYQICGDFAPSSHQITHHTQKEQTSYSQSSKRDALSLLTENNKLTKQQASEQMEIKYNSQDYKEKFEQENLNDKCKNNQFNDDDVEDSLNKEQVEKIACQEQRLSIVEPQNNEALQGINVNCIRHTKFRVISRQEEPDKQPSQYAIIQKCISKQSKIPSKNQKTLISYQSSQLQKNSKEQLNQQKTSSDEPPVLSTQIQTQQPTSIQLNSISSIQSPYNKKQHNLTQSSSFEDLVEIEDLKQKKESQNNSNYTKNMLKGFRRVVLKNYSQNIEFITDFIAYFDSFQLNNEFVLKLFSDSPYTIYFTEFLLTDPFWWMKEARIKDTENQLEFFEICKKRQFSLIRTKRKQFVRPKLA